MLMNQSSGKERIAERSRSSALVVFRVNPVHTLTRIASGGVGGVEGDYGDEGSVNTVDTPASGQSSQGPSSNGHGHAHAHSAGSVHHRRTFSTDSTAGDRTNGRVTKIDMRLLSPTKRVMPSSAPYYDRSTQSIVQGRRKKHISELRSLISEGK